MTRVRLAAVPIVLLLAFSAVAAPPPYHLQLEASPASAFPFLAKFGTATIDVYNGGLRAETFWLNGFTRNGSSGITIENPLSRMYTEMPLTGVVSTVARLGGRMISSLAQRDTPGLVSGPSGGKVHGIDAARYRISYGPTAYVDLWTTNVIPENPQLKAVVDQFVTGVSPATAAVARRIPGMPLYVELNFSHFRKVALIRTKSLTFENGGEADALKVGSFYFKAPRMDSIWK